MRTSRWLAVVGLVGATACHDTLVKPGGFSIQLDNKYFTIERLDTTSVVARIVNVDGDTVAGHEIQYQPQDPTLLSVNTTGFTRSLGPVGSTIILLRDLPDNLIDTAYATVTTTPTSIQLVPLDTAIGPFGRIQYSAVARDTSGVIPRQPFTLSFSPDSGYLLDSADVVVKGNGHRGDVAVIAHSGSVQGVAAVTVEDTLSAGELPAPGHPRWVVVLQTGQAFVSRPATDFITRYNAGARTTEASMIAPFGIAALAVDPAGTRVYLAGATLVTDLDATSGAPVDTQYTGAQPLALAVSPDGLTLWVSIVGDELLVYDRIAGGLRKTLSAATMTRFAGSPAGDSLLYGMTSGAVREINTVTDSLGRTFGGGGSLTDPATLGLSKTVTLHGRPMGVGVGPTGTVALVANDSGWVDVVPR